LIFRLFFMYKWKLKILVEFPAKECDV
jgi:hypothetical protein